MALQVEWTLDAKLQLSEILGKSHYLYSKRVDHIQIELTCNEQKHTNAVRSKNF